MYKEVAEIITSYSKQNKLISENDFLKIAYLLINERKLYNYIGDVSIDNNYSGIGKYGLIYKNILINYEKIKFLVINKNVNFIKEFSEEEIMYCHNIFLLGVFAHELEHAYQGKLIEQNDNTAETIITNLTFRSYLIYTSYKSTEAYEYQKIMDSTSFINIKPVERLANIYKEEFTKELINNLKISNNFKAYYNTKRYKTNLMHYNNFTSPTLIYLDKLKKFDDVLDKDYYTKNINILKNMKLDYEERLKLGLYISKEEKKQLTKKMFL